MRRVIAVVALVVVIILIVIGVHSCQVSARNNVAARLHQQRRH